MDDYPYIFDAPIVPHSVGNYHYNVVFLPVEIHDQLPFDTYPRLRIKGEVGHMPFAGAFQPTGGRRYLLLSKKFLKKGGFEIDDWLTVRFQIDDQDAVDVPELLDKALSQEPQAKATWDKLSPGKKRGLAYRVSSAKTEPTQMRRVEKVLEMLVLGEF